MKLRLEPLTRAEPAIEGEQWLACQIFDLDHLEASQLARTRHDGHHVDWK